MKKHLHLRNGRMINLFLGAMALLLSACANPKKILEKGHYDDAIISAAKKLRGKDEYKLKHVLVLEEAFKKAQEKDLRRVYMLREEGRAYNWTKIHKIYAHMADRQATIEPFLPIYADNGYRADFEFVKIEKLLVESRRNAADYHYNRAKDLVREGEAGNRLAAREAVDELRYLEKLYRNFKDSDRLRELAEYYGTEQWLIRMENSSHALLPRDFESRLLSISTANLNQRWRNFNTVREEGRKYDYEVVVSLDDIIFSPHIEKERQFDESLEIEDGFTYVLDENGNVMKDTLGNDIKVPRTTWISATVIEVYQFKSLDIRGRIHVRDATNRNLIHGEDLNVRHTFENYASRMVGGDKRALTKETRRRLGNAPRPFPADAGMLFDAMDALKNELSRFLRGPYV